MSGRTLPVLPCMCATLRRASRAITQLYDEALRPTGLTTTQFTILQVLALAGGVTQGELGRMLAMDSTTLTRTLDILLKQRWVNKRRGEDKRQWRLSLAPKGEIQLSEATPHWEKAQAQLRGRLGLDRWKNLATLSDELSDVITEKGEPS
jgi:DNA-binding MarR family transcriptional regulator